MMLSLPIIWNLVVFQGKFVKCKLFKLLQHLVLCCSRVHISEATLLCLNDAYEVEPGDGGSRDNHLKMLNIKTYLIKRTEPLR